MECSVLSRSGTLLSRQKLSFSPVGISQDDAQNTALFRRSLGLSLPFALDANGNAVSRAYRLTNVPTVFEISPEGQIVASIVGWSKSEVEAIYNRHLKAEAKA
jgi:peroxiredoxin